MAAGFSHRVGIHSHDWNIEQGFDLSFQTLRAQPREPHRWISTIATNFRFGNRVVAVMTDRFFTLGVMR